MKCTPGHPLKPSHAMTAPILGSSHPAHIANVFVQLAVPGRGEMPSYEIILLDQGTTDILLAPSLFMPAALLAALLRAPLTSSNAMRARHLLALLALHKFAKIDKGSTEVANGQRHL